METRRVRPQDFVDKLIVDVDCGAVNSLVFTFANGSKIELETERFQGGVYGIVVVPLEEREQERQKLEERRREADVVVEKTQHNMYAMTKKGCGVRSFYSGDALMRELGNIGANLDVLWITKP